MKDVCYEECVLRNCVMGHNGCKLFSTMKADEKEKELRKLFMSSEIEFCISAALHAFGVNVTVMESVKVGNF